MLVAFTKRLARLAHEAPAASLIKILAVLKDLLVRYRAIFKPIMLREEPSRKVGRLQAMNFNIFSR